MFKIAAHPIVAGSILCALQAATGPSASALDQWVELTNISCTKSPPFSVAR
jgi:hypothetical protein